MFYNIYSVSFHVVFILNYIAAIIFILFLLFFLLWFSWTLLYALWNVYVVLQYYCSRLAFLLTVMSKALSGAVFWISFSICKCTLYFIFRQWKKYLVFSVYTVILTDGSFCYFFLYWTDDWIIFILHTDLM